ncbi:hypothetical protein CAPTEDRAFT_160421 [Capitella teleta]|uniref:G-protein coupled receptors family 1 profile domain-containing protein n=1 Tax=Capitella teleta TaxID=283909 RepID=R7URM8_CAPTE|nr:hypothetical protein CAPTEDRAFT_160421 [Capitella teleta]|eukprot:ELU08808.1 hypothetical protein CAPTEDRAFT_160421 [Capitella teleta]
MDVMDLDFLNLDLKFFCDFNSSFNISCVQPNETIDVEDKINEPIVKAVLILLYSIVIILGALLNTLVVSTVIKTKQMWNATNIFIANLATADIFVCVFDLPLSLYQTLTQNWIFGKTLCHIIPMTFGVVVYTSTLSLTMIAIDRFVLIVFPLRKRMTVSLALSLVVVIAMVSMAVASPIAIFATSEDFDIPILNIHKQICREKWPSVQHRRVYTIVTVIAQFFLPLALILVLYVLIFKTLRNRMQNRKSRKTKTTRMLVAVVLVFAMTWTPFHLFAIIMDFKPQLVHGSYIRLIDALLKVIALSSSCINPLLYGWMNDNYRNAFFSIIRKPTATPVNIHREDSDEMTKTTKMTKTITNNSNCASKTAPKKQILQKVNPNSKTCSVEAKNTDEVVPLQEGLKQPAANGEEKCVLVTMENGHCHASVQTPLLP